MRVGSERITQQNKGPVKGETQVNKGGPRYVGDKKSSLAGSNAETTPDKQPPRKGESAKPVPNSSKLTVDNYQ